MASMQKHTTQVLWNAPWCNKKTNSEIQKLMNVFIDPFYKNIKSHMYRLLLFSNSNTIKNDVEHYLKITFQISTSHSRIIIRPHGFGAHNLFLMNVLQQNVNRYCTTIILVVSTGIVLQSHLLYQQVLYFNHTCCIVE